jgi:Cysteine-rich CPXCG
LASHKLQSYHEKPRKVGLLKILFLHGWHSVVGGVKPKYLQLHGNEVLNPMLDDDNFEIALKTAQAEFDSHQPDVVVGSSRGGAIAISIEHGSIPLVLLCPAWKKWGVTKKLNRNSLILHSRHDETIPFADSEELVRNSQLPLGALIETGHDHRLADDDSLSVMLWACNVLDSGEFLTLDEDPQDYGHSPKTTSGSSQGEASYICDACGEVIVIPVDLSEGISQQYVEDCPVCCRANIIHVHVDDEGKSQVWAEPE